MYEQILYEVRDPVATITLNRPERLNAWTGRMARELRDAVARAEADPAVVAIVLTGAGRGFCSGADMDFLASIGEGRGNDRGAEGPEAEPGDAEMGKSFRGTYSYLLSIRKPIIAAINGACAGMALPIILYCDLRFASDRASFFAAFPQRGLIAEWGVGWILPRVVGTANAMDLLLSGRKVDAREAEQMGLVNRVVPHQDLLKLTHEFAEELAARCSPTSLRIIKQQVYQAWTETLGEAFDKSVRLMAESFRRADFKEGVRAFLDRRPARFERIPAPDEEKP